MRESDLAFAAACTRAEGWRCETREVLEGFLLHDRRGCFVAEERGSRIGIGVATAYGDAGFVGEIVVVRKARGGSVGPRLLRRALEYLEGRGVHSIYLDGVEAATPYYEHAGFRKVCRSMRFVGVARKAAHDDVRPMEREDLDAISALDREAFGADRRFFLERRQRLHPRLCRVLQSRGFIGGYIMAAVAEGMVSVGPWLVREGAQEPIHLLEGLALETGSAPLRMGVLESNETAVRAIRGLKTFEEQHASWRMVRGRRGVLGSSSVCWAIGGAAKG